MSPTAEVAPPPESLAGTDAEVVVAGAPESLLDPTPRRRPLWVPVLTYVMTVFVLITLNFALPRLMPGDPIQALMAFGDPNYVQNDKTRSDLAEYYGLDKSLPEQYVDYLGRLAHGDLGTSITSNRPVRTEIAGKIWWSALLIVTAMGLSVLFSLPVGIHAGWKRGGRLDRGLQGFVMAAQNLPIFILAAVAFVVLAAKLGVVPYGGAETPFSEYTGLARVADIARHLWLPAVVMAFDFATFQYLVMRSSMVGELGSDYLMGGRAKGLRERRLKYRYAGRNALLPVVTVIGLNFGFAIASTLFIETIFVYPGIGGYMIGSLGTRDYPAIQGSFLILTITVVTANLLTDLLYRRLDPRTTK